MFSPTLPIFLNSVESPTLRSSFARVLFATILTTDLEEHAHS